MSNQEEMLQSLRNQVINPNPGAVDGNPPAGSEVVVNTPAAPTQAEMNSILESIDKDQEKVRTENQNNAKFLGFVAKGPHRGKYVVDVLGKPELEVTTTKSEYKGQMKPVRVPKNANFQTDAVAIQMPDGKVTYVLLKRLVDWLLNQTWGAITPSEEGKSLELQKPKKPTTDGKIRPLRVRPVGASKSDPNEVIISYEEERDEKGEVVYKTEQIALDPQVPTEKGETVPSIRGTVQFPVFVRKEEFKSLGAITTAGNKTRKLTDEESILTAREEFADLFAHHRKEQGF